MDELIGRLVADAGVDRAAAEKAVGIILDFLVKEGPANKVRLLLAKLPGADALMQKAATDNAGGSCHGGSHGGGHADDGGGVEYGRRCRVLPETFSPMHARRPAQRRLARSALRSLASLNLFEFGLFDTTALR